MRRPSVEELNAMTLQIGMVGSDGIVLASDTMVQQYENDSRSVSHCSKFFLGAEVLCCYAGDTIAERCAYGIRSHDWSPIASSSEKEDTRLALIQIGNLECRKTEDQYGTLPNVIRKVLAVIHSNQLWLLEINGKDGSTANLIRDRAVSGDVANTCRYFMNKYANDCLVRPISELICLAAYTILAAGEENPHGVGGLEIYVIQTRKPPVLLNATQEQALKDWFKQTTKVIKNRLSRQFDFIGADN